MMKQPKISEAERAVLEVLWQNPPHPSSEIVRRLAHRSWSETTIKTLVARLVKKGFAAYEVEGNRYFYRPLITREQSLAQETTQLMARWDGAEFALLAQFVESAQLTPEQIEVLEGILEGKHRGGR